jgi:hypothetical protein
MINNNKNNNNNNQRSCRGGKGVVLEVPAPAGHVELLLPLLQFLKLAFVIGMGAIQEILSVVSCISRGLVVVDQVHVRHRGLGRQCLGLHGLPFSASVAFRTSASSVLYYFIFISFCLLAVLFLSRFQHVRSTTRVVSCVSRVSCVSCRVAGVDENVSERVLSLSREEIVTPQRRGGSRR